MIFNKTNFFLNTLQNVGFEWIGSTWNWEFLIKHFCIWIILCIPFEFVTFCLVCMYIPNNFPAITHSVRMDLNKKSFTKQITMGPFTYCVRKIVGGWVQSIAYYFLYTGWMGLKEFLRKILIHEKSEKSAKFSTNASKLSHKMSLLLIMTIFLTFSIPVLCLN